MNQGPLEKLKFNNRRKLPNILQSEASECGLACLCMITNYFGHNIDLFSLRRRYPISLKGANLKQLIQVADFLKLSARTLRVELDQLYLLKGPVILHWDMNHFVVLKAVKRNCLVIHDPGKGVVKLSMAEASKSFTGIVLELKPTEEFKEKEETLQLGFSVLWNSIIGLKRSLSQILILSLALQLFALISPYFIQLAVDNVVVTGDTQFLTMLGIGFVLLVLIKVATQVFRSWVLVYLRTTLGIQLISNLFRHLLRLPMDWFGKRFIGDVMSRFNSLDYIKDMLSQGFVEGVIDGGMAVLTLIMMFVFSPTLAFITLFSVSIFALIKTFLFQATRSRTKESIQLKSLSNSLFYESIRSVQPIKIYNGESTRQAKLENSNADWMNAEINLSRLNIIQVGFKDFLYGLEYVLIIWVGASLVLNETLTIGMLFAFLSYRLQFATSSQTLLEKIFQWRMMGLHLSRIADIALEDQEINLQTEMPVPTNIKGKLELQNISYRYNPNEPDIFSNLSITIEAGECVVIVAPSGYGKTTLMKLMMGLIKPTQGKIVFDGIDIEQLGLMNYRQLCSAVMQGDSLLSGSIADNISFFATEQHMVLLEKVAAQACILDDIRTMPMNFHTLAGDMGSTLSGGQVQRILLARALYKEPAILFLDEASSALDINTERRINETLKAMGMTRIMIAHRQETIQMADRVIDLEELSLHSKTNEKELNKLLKQRKLSVVHASGGNHAQ